MKINDMPELPKDKSLATETKYVNLKSNLKKLIIDNNMNALKLSKATGVPNSTISDWLLGNSPKNITQVKSVAMHFNLSVDDLVFSDLKNKKRVLSVQLVIISVNLYRIMKFNVLYCPENLEIIQIKLLVT